MVNIYKNIFKNNDQKENNIQILQFSENWKLSLVSTPCSVFLVAAPSTLFSASSALVDHPLNRNSGWLPQTPSISTYQTRSTKPPCWAINCLTLFAYSTEVSPCCWWTGGRYQTSQTIAQLVIIINRYSPMEYLLLFQKASPNLRGIIAFSLSLNWT